MVMNWTDAELAGLRDAQTSAMPEWAKIEDQTSTPDNRGGWTDAFTARPVTVPARLAEPNSEELNALNGRFGDASHWVLTLPAETQISPGARVTIREAVYVVTAVSGPQSFDTALRCFARKIED